MKHHKKDIPLERRLGLVKRRIVINQRIQQLTDPERKKANLFPAKDCSGRGLVHGIRQSLRHSLAQHLRRFQE